jgi:hypothetical protein
MVGRRKAIRTLATAAAIMSSFVLPAYSQGFTNRKPQDHGGPLIEKKPVVDEKAYNAALGRIPTPDQKYDPWGIARPPEGGKIGKKEPAK